MGQAISVLFCYAYRKRSKRYTNADSGDSVSPAYRSKAECPPAGVSRAVQGITANGRG